MKWAERYSLTPIYNMDYCVQSTHEENKSTLHNLVIAVLTLQKADEG